MSQAATLVADRAAVGRRPSRRRGPLAAPAQARTARITRGTSNEPPRASAGLTPAGQAAGPDRPGGRGHSAGGAASRRLGQAAAGAGTASVAAINCPPPSSNVSDPGKGGCLPASRLAGAAILDDHARHPAYGHGPAPGTLPRFPGQMREDAALIRDRAPHRRTRCSSGSMCQRRPNFMTSRFL